MKGFLGSASTSSKEAGKTQPPVNTTIPSDPPPAYTPDPDFSTSTSGGASSARSNISPSANAPSSAGNASSSVPSSSRISQSPCTPTDQPVPGRPLLRDGKCLVYKPGFFCEKCGNTGFKNDDPYHPCKSCWKKYSRPYTSAIAHSWAINTPHDEPSNLTTHQAQNYQRPLLLTNFRPSAATPYTSPPPPGVTLNHSLMRPGLIERGAQQNRSSSWSGRSQPPPRTEKYGYGGAQGSIGPPPPLPPMMPMQPGFGSPHQYPMMPNGYAGQQGALHVLPGDPRIGGLPCQYCRSLGTVPTFFGLDNDLCPVCRGVGRVF